MLGRPRLTKKFLNLVMSVKPYACLYISLLTTPVIMAVVVAMAGMILPAIIFVLFLSLSTIL